VNYEERAHIEQVLAHTGAEGIKFIQAEILLDVAVQLTRIADALEASNARGRLLDKRRLGETDEWLREHGLGNLVDEKHSGEMQSVAVRREVAEGESA
jgi:hypothetical protein